MITTSITCLNSQSILIPLYSFLIGPVAASFSIIFVFSILYNWQYISFIKFADVWIRTAYLWCRMRPLYQLSHNHAHLYSFLQHNLFQFKLQFVHIEQKLVFKSWILCWTLFLYLMGSIVQLIASCRYNIICSKQLINFSSIGPTCN